MDNAEAEMESRALTERFNWSIAHDEGIGVFTERWHLTFQGHFVAEFIEEGMATRICNYLNATRFLA